jgi:hypothetical protein
MTTDDGLDTITDGERFRWRWVSPWAVERYSPATYASEKTALAAGRRWLKDHARG